MKTITMKGKEKAPEEFQKLIGTKQTMGGCLFSRNEIEFKQYDVIDWRWGSARIMDMKTLKVKHPTIELLVKNSEMKASRWTKPFPVRSVNLNEEE